jgi:cobalamin synthase
MKDSDLESRTTTEHQKITAKSARKAAGLFNIGNIISMLMPFPLGIFWMGLSMVVYAMNRHHPNEKVGNYTQQAAYRFYGVVGFVVVVAIFFGTEIYYWLVTWALCAAILIPWSIVDLIRIRKDDWQDSYFTNSDNNEESV